MKMLVVDDEAFELELSRSMRVADVVSLPAKGRGNNNAVPDSVRKLVAHEAINGAAARDVAATFNVSESSVSAYKNGATSTTTYNSGKGELKEYVDMTRDRIKSKAQNKLLLALKHMTEDKLENTKGVELSTIAANMSRVVDKMTPKSDGNVVTNNIVFYSPKQISKENFETIDLVPESR